MFLPRLVAILLSLGIAVSLIQWMLTGQPHYRTRAWNIFRVGLVVIFVILALFALERLLDQ